MASASGFCPFCSAITIAHQVLPLNVLNWSVLPNPSKASAVGGRGYWVFVTYEFIQNMFIEQTVVVVIVIAHRKYLCVKHYPKPVCIFSFNHQSPVR